MDDPEALEDRPVRCPLCHGEITVGHPIAVCSAGHYYHTDCASAIVRCPMCEASFEVLQTGTKIEVKGTNASEVQQVSIALLAKSREVSAPTRVHPWMTGSFYVLALVVLTLTGLVTAKLVPLVALPIVLIFGALALSVIGAMQLRHDNQLSEKSFISLMLASLKSLPLLKRGKR
jgi:hypothetical protein